MNHLKLHQKSEHAPPSLSELREALEPNDNSPFDKEFFERAFVYMEQFQDREISLNQQLSVLYGQLDELDLSMSRLNPMDIAELLEILRKEIEVCPNPLTNLLQEKLLKLQKVWDRLNFLFFFSIAQELNSDSFQGNFYHRLSIHIEELKKKKSKEASRLERTLISLQKQCKAAEEVFCGKGLDAYFRLPEEIRLDIEQRLFERYPNFSIRKAETEEDREVITAAIMASLSERMQSTQLSE